MTEQTEAYGRERAAAWPGWLRCPRRPLMAIDGRKFKARMQPLDKSIARHMKELDRAHRKPALVTETRVEHIKEKVETVKKQMRERYC